LTRFQLTTSAIAELLVVVLISVIVTVSQIPEISNSETFNHFLLTAQQVILAVFIVYIIVTFSES